jgi:hypothetical protein
MIWRIGVFSFACLCAAQTLPQAVSPNSPAKKSWQTIQRGEKFVPMTGEERLQFLLRRAVLSGGTPARALILAAVDQKQNDPVGWGQGWDAYGRRVGSRWVRSGIRNTIESGAAAALGYEQRYIQCDCDGVLRRSLHAFAMNFVTYNREGKWVPNVPRVGSTIATEYIYLSWLPEGARSAHDATRGLGYSLATGAASNLWREFSPPLMRKLKKKIPMMNR